MLLVNMTVVCVYLLFCLILSGSEATGSEEWVVRIEGGNRVAKRVARNMGYDYKGPVSSILIFKIVLLLSKYRRYTNEIRYIITNIRKRTNIRKHTPKTA